MTDKPTSGMHAVSRALLVRLHGWLTHIHHYRADDMAELEAILAQPATAKVDEQDIFESVFPMPAHTMRFKGGYASTEFNAWASHEFVQKWEGWQARAKLNGGAQ